MTHLRDHGFTRIEAEVAAGEAWTQHLAEVAAATLLPLADSATVSRAPRGNHGEMRLGDTGACQHFPARLYRDFGLTKASRGA